MSDERQDGIYENISMSEYRAWPYANYSALKILAQGGTPAHYKYYIDNQVEDESDAQAFGQLVHTALLEPERLDLFQPLPEHIKRRVGDDWEKLHADNPDILYLPPAEWKEKSELIALARKVRETALQNAVIEEFLSISKPEVSMIWTDPDTSIRCKARMDLFHPTRIADIKTTRLFVPTQIGRSGYKWAYHIQSAMYSDGASILLKKNLYLDTIPFWFIFIESNPPHLITIHDGHSAYDERSEEHNPTGFLDIGREQYKRALKDVKLCTESNTWNGHSDNPMEMVIPRYAGWESE